MALKKHQNECPEGQKSGNSCTSGCWDECDRSGTPNRHFLDHRDQCERPRRGEQGVLEGQRYQDPRVGDPLGGVGRGEPEQVGPGSGEGDRGVGGHHAHVGEGGHGDAFLRQAGEATRRKHMEHANALVNRLKSIDAGATILFSDEKFFTLAQYHNRRNSHVVLNQGEVSDLRVQGVAQRPGGVMFLGVVASDGRVAPPPCSP